MRRPVALRLAIALAILAVLGSAFLVIERSRTAQPVRQEARTPQVFDRTLFVAALDRAGFALGDKAHVRIFKRERRLELWLSGAADDGRFRLFRSYEICNYSGTLGPKLKEGDHQAPEGFYRVALSQLNPNSRHHLSFNLGFPNAYDRQLDRTGSALMVHGGCSSVGCYAIGDEQVDEVYAVVEAALKAGQPAVDVHAFPFRLTNTALAAEAGHIWAPFWRNLKAGHDLFDARRQPPRVGACRGEYLFDTAAEGPECAAIAAWS
jgi:murein L,D-transpeptidase YafK